MQITWIQGAVVCFFVFLAGLVDAIGGGGGLISLPAYLLAGLPAHYAIATNKMSSMCGTCVATWRFIREKLVNWKLAVPSVVAAVLGSSMGSRLSLIAPEQLLLTVLVVVLPVAAFIVLNKKLFGVIEDETIHLDKRTFVTAILAALIVGFYDGFYGPGTGTFLIIAFTVFARLGIKSANAQCKVINLTTNVTSFVVFFLHGQVLLYLGIPAALCNMLGGYIGAGLVMKGGAKIVRPSIIIVLILLAIKVISGN